MKLWRTEKRNSGKDDTHLWRDLDSQEQLRSKLPRVVNQLIYIKQRKQLERTIGLFHAVWANLEWRIWALDAAHQGDGTFEPLSEGSTRRFLDKPYEYLNEPIKRLSEFVTLDDDLVDLNRRRNQIIHGTIIPSDIRHHNLNSEPILVSSKLMGVMWADAYVVPTFQALVDGQLGRYKRMYRRSDIRNLTMRVSDVSRELDGAYLLQLYSKTMQLMKDRLKELEEDGS